MERELIGLTVTETGIWRKNKKRRAVGVYFGAILSNCACSNICATDENKELAKKFQDAQTKLSKYNGVFTAQVVLLPEEKYEVKILERRGETPDDMQMLVRRRRVPPAMPPL